MKKNILRMFVVFALILSCSLCLVACGNADKKKEEELAGKYLATQVEYKMQGQSSYTTVTREQYEAMSEDDREEFDEYFAEYNVKLDDHKVWVGEGTVATWKVVDGKLVIEPDEPEEGVTFSAEVVDSNIIITMEQKVMSAKLTLAKVA